MAIAPSIGKRPSQFHVTETEKRNESFNFSSRSPTFPLINHYLINEIVLFSEFEFCWQLSYECSTLNFCWCFIHTHATPTWRLTFLFISIISRINWNSPASIRVFLIIIVLSSHWCWCYYIMNERVRVVFIWKGGCCWRCCCCHYQLVIGICHLFSGLKIDVHCTEF